MREAYNRKTYIKGVLRRFMVLVNILLQKMFSWLLWAFMGLLCVFGGVLVFGGASGGINYERVGER